MPLARLVVGHYQTDRQVLDMHDPLVQRSPESLVGKAVEREIWMASSEL